jgi:hypothetical protein
VPNVSVNDGLEEKEIKICKFFKVRLLITRKNKEDER